MFTLSIIHYFVAVNLCSDVQTISDSQNEFQHDAQIHIQNFYQKIKVDEFIYITLLLKYMHL